MDKRWETVELVPAAKVRDDIAKYLSDASDNGVRIGITRHNKPVAAIVPFTDVMLLETMDEKAMAAAEAEDEGIECGEAVQTPLFCGGADQLASYLTGQIAARIADAKILGEQHIFNIVQGIVARTINDTFDQKVSPNPPYEVGTIVMGTTNLESAHLEPAGDLMVAMSSMPVAVATPSAAVRKRQG